MARQHEEIFKDLDEGFPSQLVTAWREMNTTAELRDNKWWSPFSLTETPATSFTLKLFELTHNELMRWPDSVGSSHADNDIAEDALNTGAAWVVDGIQIETQQRRLAHDATQAGSSLTARQALGLATRRKELAKRIESHSKSAREWIPAAVFSSTSGPDSHSFQRSAQKRHVRGTIATTRAESLLRKLSDKIDLAQREYNESRGKLFQLGMSSTDAKTFHVLTDEDIEQLRNLVANQDKLGDGHLVLPWYWRVSLASDKEDALKMVANGIDVKKEYDESLRVQWFRARARMERWQEEVLWLQCEAASLIHDFLHRSRTWECIAEDSAAQGWKSYAFSQSDVWHEMAKRTLAHVKPILQLMSPQNPSVKELCIMQPN
ncbi:hypothetical protein FRC11_010018 [Ceratobasidium sp. 423]|nr:hypothetical protein FRC11_010018 [Ceratobasidium sp. 423]